MTDFVWSSNDAKFSLDWHRAFGAHNLHQTRLFNEIKAEALGPVVIILGPAVQRPGKVIHCINHYPLDKYHQKPLARAFQRMAIFPGDPAAHPAAHPEKQLGATDKASRLEAMLLGVISDSEKDSSTNNFFDHF